MSLTTTDHLSLTLQSIKKLLSLKANKNEVTPLLKEEDAIKLAVDMDFIEPIIADDGSIYTDRNGNIYSLI